MNKRGFTLIELLAVIVILAIIALIATPIILNIIKESRESAGLRSAEMYLKGVETSVATATINNKKLEDGTYPITPTGDICLVELTSNTCEKDNTLEVEMNGEKPSSGSIMISNGKITDIELTYTNGKTIVKNDGKLVYREPYKVYENGDVVYFDVNQGKSCTNYTEAQSVSEVKSGCMKFYAFNDDGGEKLNLILDHNTTLYRAKWISDEGYVSLGGDTTNREMIDTTICDIYNEFCVGNDKGPKEVLDQLKLDTSDWVGTLTPTTYQGNGYKNSTYTIDYGNLGIKARLITAEEIAKIQNVNLNEVNSISDLPLWLSEFNASTNFMNSGGFGYWTSSAVSTSVNAWAVRSNYSGSGTGMYNVASLSKGGFNATIYFYGVRPVIEVSKNNL